MGGNRGRGNGLRGGERGATAQGPGLGAHEGSWGLRDDRHPYTWGGGTGIRTLQRGKSVQIPSFTLATATQLLPLPGLVQGFSQGLEPLSLAPDVLGGGGDREGQ